MDYTKNLRLSKPSYDDDVDVQVLNNNMDIIDYKVKYNTDKFDEYLPLTGGTMLGNIKVGYNIGLWYNQTHYLNFYNTNFKGVMKDTVLLKGDRFKYCAPSGKELVADDTGVWFDNVALLRDLSTDVGDYSGYTKLSNGMTIQWGIIKAGDYDGNVQHVTLKLPMFNSYCVYLQKSNQENGKPQTLGGDDWVTSYNHVRTGFDVVCDSNDTSKYVFWLAIGKAVN